MGSKGKVYIMGVGPGDYKLITLRAMESIAKSDVVVYDRLVHSKILEFAKENAELIYVGKMPDHHAVPQEGINEILVKKALEGKTVARVKGGDPFMFGRGGEEAEALFEEHIEFEIIPGVTSAISVPAYAGIPVTHRDFCSSLHIITGHEKLGRVEGNESSYIHYEVLAKLEGTLVFLMGVKNLPEISANLIKFGKDKTTPVAVIEKGTTHEQRTVVGTLETIRDIVIQANIKSPAVTVVGKVVTLREKLEWFPKGVLAGKKVIVTRSREQASVLVKVLEDMGGEVFEFPTIKIVEPSDFTMFDETLGNIKSYQWMVFTSVNGVESFFKRLNEKKMDIRSLVHLKICAVGQVTADELNKRGILIDYMPTQFTTAHLLKGLLELVKPTQKVLLVRSDIANPEIAQGLSDNHIEFTDLVAYRTIMGSSNTNLGSYNFHSSNLHSANSSSYNTDLGSSTRDEILKCLEEKKVDFITFTSSSTVRNFVSILGKQNVEKLKNTKIISIGPVTTETALELGLHVDGTADVFTIDGMIKKLVENLT